ncbi:MAG: DUF1540 domain-containing protein [Peptostreptococcaceae bacterium]
MANLHCSALNCGNNTQGECFAGNINIFGACAHETETTICGSFIDQSISSLSNYINTDSLKTDQINCRAQNCVYNDMASCTAQGVQINALNASCNTFKPE